MKRTLVTLLGSTLLILVSACQKAPSLTDTQATVVQQFGSHISSAIGTRALLIDGSGSTASAYGTASTDPSVLYSSLFNSGSLGGWSPYSGTPFGGSYVQSDLESQLRTCLSLVRGIQPSSENYDFMVGTLARCLNTALAYRNPLMTYGFQNFDPSSQSYYQYGLNALQPGIYSNFSSNPTLLQYASQGYVP